MRTLGTIVAILTLLTLLSCAPQEQPVIPSVGPEAVETAPVSEPEPAPVETAVAEPAPMEAVPQTIDVQIKNFAFGPATITINKGDTVRWTNMDSAAHTATGDEFDTGRLAKGQSKEITFDKEGTYDYLCSIHPRMKGQIVVQ